MTNEKKLKSTPTLQLTADVETIREIAKLVPPDTFLQFAENILTISSEVEASKTKLKELHSHMVKNGYPDVGEDEFIHFMLSQQKEKTLKSEKPKTKYEFPGEDGAIKTWSSSANGKGRKPKELQALLDKGRKLEEFIVENNSES